jgi:hypothetical protein
MPPGTWPPTDPGARSPNCPEPPNKPHGHAGADKTRGQRLDRLGERGVDRQRPVTVRVGAQHVGQYEGVTSVALAATG